MKKLKGAFATLLICLLLLGNTEIVQVSRTDNKDNILLSGEVTTLEDPRPIGE